MKKTILSLFPNKPVRATITLPLLKWISTTTHHDMHHGTSFNHNYGFYFTWWDKLMGTEHPDYRDGLRALVDRLHLPAFGVGAVPTPRKVRGNTATLLGGVIVAVISGSGVGMEGIQLLLAKGMKIYRVKWALASYSTSSVISLMPRSWAKASVLRFTLPRTKKGILPNSAVPLLAQVQPASV